MPSLDIQIIYNNTKFMNNISPDTSFGDFTNEVQLKLQALNYNARVDFQLHTWSDSYMAIKKSPIGNFKHIRNKILDYCDETISLSELKQIKDKKNKSFYPLRFLLNQNTLGNNVNSVITLKLFAEAVNPRQNASNYPYPPTQGLLYCLKGNEQSYDIETTFSNQQNLMVMPEVRRQRENIPWIDAHYSSVKVNNKIEESIPYRLEHKAGLELMEAESLADEQIKNTVENKSKLSQELNAQSDGFLGTITHRILNRKRPLNNTTDNEVYSRKRAKTYDKTTFHKRCSLQQLSDQQKVTRPKI